MILDMTEGYAVINENDSIELIHCPIPYKEWDEELYNLGDKITGSQKLGLFSGSSERFVVSVKDITDHRKCVKVVEDGVTHLVVK